MQELYSKQNLSKQLFSSTQNTNSISNIGNIYTTENFEIYVGTKKPGTTLWNDYNQNGTPDYIDTVKNEIEFIYNKLINEKGFKKPLGEGKIKIYIANSDLYLNSEILTMTNDYVGWALYENNESYFVLNGNITSPSISTSSKEIIKVTLAHEFFHLIQYAYNLDFDNNNLWLYESTAVFIEYLVYPKITDYLKTYGNSLGSSLKRGLIDYYHLNPYASNLFFDFLKNKYNDKNMIKKIWQNFEISTNSISSVKTFLQEYNSTIEQELYEYTKAILYENDKFSNSQIFTEYIKVKNTLEKCESSSIDYFGFYSSFSSFSNDECNLVELSLKDNFTKIKVYDGNITLSTNVASLVSKDDIFVILPSNESLNVTNTQKEYKLKVSKYKPKLLNHGWNLLSTHKNIDLKYLDKSNFKYIWKFSDKNWEIWSDKNIENSFATLEKIQKGDGFWIYSYYDNIEFNLGSDLSQSCDFELNSGWNLKGTNCLTSYSLKKIDSLHNIQYAWIYKNNKWYLNKTGYDFETFNELEYNQGIWIKK